MPGKDLSQGKAGDVSPSPNPASGKKTDPYKEFVPAAGDPPKGLGQGESALDRIPKW